MIWSVASLRLNCRRSACERSTATCLNDWISSPARCRLPTSCCAASRRAADEFLELRAPQRRAGSHLGLELVGAAGEARRHRQADADRIVDLMGDAGDQAAERGQPFGIDQVLLGGVQFQQRGLRPSPWRPATRPRPRAWRWRFRGTPRPRAPSRRPRPWRRCPAPGDRSRPSVIARIDVMICCSGSRMLSAIMTPAVMMMAEKEQRDRQHPVREYCSASGRMSPGLSARAAAS